VASCLREVSGELLALRLKLDERNQRGV